MGLLLLYPGQDQGWARVSPLPWYPTTGLRAPVPAWPPTHVFAMEQEARVLGFNFLVKTEVRDGWAGPFPAPLPVAHGTEAHLPLGQRVLTVLNVVDVM